MGKGMFPLSIYKNSQLKGKNWQSQTKEGGVYKGVVKILEGIIHDFLLLNLKNLSLLPIPLAG